MSFLAIFSLNQNYVVRNIYIVNFARVGDFGYGFDFD